MTITMPTAELAETREALTLAEVIATYDDIYN